MAITWVLPLMLHYFYAICHSCRQKPPLSCCGRPTANNMVLKISLHHGQQSPGRESGVLLPLSLLTPPVTDSSLCFALYGPLTCPLNLCFHRISCISPAVISTMCFMASHGTGWFRGFINEILDHIKDLMSMNPQINEFREKRAFWSLTPGD